MLSKVKDALEKPILLSFGLVTDVQFADVQDGWNFLSTRKRYYRNALILLKQVVEDWMSLSDTPHGKGTLAHAKMRFAVNLGDLIDGKNRAQGNSKVALKKAKEAFASFEKHVGPIHHLLGNHELYNFSSRDFATELLWKRDRSFDDIVTPLYYKFVDPNAPKICFVVLNTFGFTTLGCETTDPSFQIAREYLCKRNKNPNLNSPAGLHGLDQRFVEYNGGIDTKQLDWLRGVLDCAKKRQERVVIFTHVPLHPDSCPHSCLLWNYKEILDVLFAFTDTVCAVFSGHAHEAGQKSERGIHFIVLDALLECHASETAHAVVNVYENHLEVMGFGKTDSVRISLSD